MSSNERGLVLALLSTAPALCCLIAAGVFLYQFESTTRPSDPAVAQVARQEDVLAVKRAAIAHLEREIARCRSAIEEASATARARQDRETERQAASARLADLRGRQELLGEGLAREEARRKRLIDAGSDLEGLRFAEKKLQDQLAAETAEQKRLVADRDAALMRKKEQEKVYSVTALSGGSSMVIRRALFVECTRGGITLQPQGRRLSTAPNPSEQQAFLSAAGGTGYVVFLIRPDGYDSFHRYRSLARSAGLATGDRIDIGYEPVDPDWVLTYPDQKKEAVRHVASGSN